MDSEATAQKARVRAQFDTAALEYDTGPGCFAYFGKRLVESAEILPDHRVLDVATGRGAAFFPAAELLSNAGEIVGIDLSDEMVRATNAEATRRGVPGRAQVMDAEHLVFKDATWRVAQISEILAAIDELGMKREQAPGWIAEPEKLSSLLIRAGSTDVSVRIESHSFKYVDVEEYWQQALGTGLRRTLDNLDPGDAERLLTALRRRVCSGGAKGFSSVSTALIGLGRR
jgi:SAM-dependent methyltransferase